MALWANDTARRFRSAHAGGHRMHSGLTFRSTGRAGTCLQLGVRLVGAPVTSNVRPQDRCLRCLSLRSPPAHRMHRAPLRMQLSLPLRTATSLVGGFVPHGLRPPLCARRFCGSYQFSQSRRALDSLHRASSAQSAAASWQGPRSLGAAGAFRGRSCRPSSRSRLAMRTLLPSSTSAWPNSSLNRTRRLMLSRSQTSARRAG
jgi:hypothetical protein